jgi:hypothetical protein
MNQPSLDKIESDGKSYLVVRVGFRVGGRQALVLRAPLEAPRPLGRVELGARPKRERHLSDCWARAEPLMSGALRHGSRALREDKLSSCGRLIVGCDLLWTVGGIARLIVV